MTNNKTTSPVCFLNLLIFIPPIIIYLIDLLQGHQGL
jgi:hypothetical protein